MAKLRASPPISRLPIVTLAATWRNSTSGLGGGGAGVEAEADGADLDEGVDLQQQRVDLEHEAGDPSVLEVELQAQRLGVVLAVVAPVVGGVSGR